MCIICNQRITKQKKRRVTSIGCEAKIYSTASYQYQRAVKSNSAKQKQNDNLKAFLFEIMHLLNCVMVQCARNKSSVPQEFHYYSCTQIYCLSIDYEYSHKYYLTVLLNHCVRMKNQMINIHLFYFKNVDYTIRSFF